MSLYPEPEAPLFGEGIPAAATPTNGRGTFFDSIGAAVGVTDKTAQRIIGAAIVIAGIALVGFLLLRLRRRG